MSAYKFYHVAIAPDPGAVSPSPAFSKTFCVKQLESADIFDIANIIHCRLYEYTVSVYRYTDSEGCSSRSDGYMLTKECEITKLIISHK